MSKAASANLITHIAGELTTLATCWLITRTDTTVFAFTDHDQDLTVDGVTYVASTGFTASAINTTGTLAVPDLEVEGVLSSSSITEEDLLAGLWDHAAVKVFLVNWADLAQGILRMRRGWLGEVSNKAGSFVAELRGLAAALQRTQGRKFLAACDADFGDARCTITLASHTDSATVGASPTARVFVAAALVASARTFPYGKVTFTSGLNNGLSMEVKAFTAGTGEVELMLPMPRTVTAGDTFTIHAGCDKSLAACIVYSNVLNFRGFPYLQTQDTVIAGPSAPGVAPWTFEPA